ncbi:MAG: single-stranded-DNA-specific exonuclease RecJ [Candidatus Magasanikbacteria bacterium]|nr:single-stranded-DNA-specific exonuclease RecJ [Candidatus Magasanikbacteria bacterium]
MTKRWQLAEPCTEDLAKIFHIAQIPATLLWNRGIRTAKEAQQFLSPSFEEHLHHPSVFRDAVTAVERVFTALKNGERITVHGDYDADGVTGSTLVLTVLFQIADRMQVSRDLIDYYIPHRDKEGYGLQMGTVPKLVDRGTSLLITVDCGISCVAEIAHAKEQGIDTIVLDHHQFGDALPDGLLIHPGLPNETYPFKDLAAVGVSYKFALLLIDEARKQGLEIVEGWEKWLLDLVAIATVTDMVPLHGENRVLETFGLRVLNKTRRPGFLALFESAGLQQGAITSESVGFAIGPRINAAGRMDHAELALKLLLAESLEEAKIYAKELERCNRLRQETTRRMMDEADKMVDTSKEIIVLSSPDWSPALVGLVAGRYLESTGKPVIAIGKHGDQWIGSGRSPSHYDITVAVREAGEGLLTRSGGHVQACGFALHSDENVPLFAQKLYEHAAANLTEEDVRPILNIDMELDLSSVTMPLIEAVNALEPFGMGNAVPVFMSKKCLVVSADAIGQKKDVLRMQLQDQSGATRKGIGFRLGTRVAEFTPGSWVDVAYSLSANEWNGRVTAELRIIDVKLCN